MAVNWKVRLKHKQFWVALVALLLVLANQVAQIFGYNIEIYNAQITSITETVLTILGLLGVVIDPTTQGTSDSYEALHYNKPKENR